MQQQNLRSAIRAAETLTPDSLQDILGRVCIIERDTHQTARSNHLVRNLCVSDGTDLHTLQLIIMYWSCCVNYINGFYSGCCVK